MAKRYLAHMEGNYGEISSGGTVSFILPIIYDSSRDISMQFLDVNPSSMQLIKLFIYFSLYL